MEATSSTLQNILQHLSSLQSDGSFDTVLQEYSTFVNSPALFSEISKKLDEYLTEVVLGQIAQLCAELAKEERFRGKLEPQLPRIALFLASTSNHETSYQLHRACGNICFDNDSGRQVLLEAGGVPILVKNVEETLMRALGSSGEGDGLINQSSAAENLRMIRVTLGCLCNVLDSYQPCQSVAMDSGILPSFISILSFPVLQSLHPLVLSAVQSISDDLSLRGTILESSLPSTVISLLKVEDIAEDVVEMIVDLLTVFICSTEGLPTLTKRGAVSALLFVLNRRVSSFSNGVLQSTGNLLVEWVADPECVEMLSRDDAEMAVASAARWLVDGGKNRALTTVAALLLGNMARNEETCREIMELPENVAVRLLEIVRSLAADESLHHPETTSSDPISSDHDHSELSAAETTTAPQLLYAALSALKNLAVNENLRAQLISSDLIPSLLAVSDSIDLKTAEKSLFPVISRLLSLLRMSAALSESTASPIADNRDLIAGALFHADNPFLSRECFRLLILLLDYPILRPKIVEILSENSVCDRLTELLLGSIADQVGSLALANAVWKSPESDLIELNRDILQSDLITALKTRLEDEKIDSAVLGQILNFVSVLLNFSSVRPILTEKIRPAVEGLRLRPVNETVKGLVESILEKLL